MAVENSGTKGSRTSSSGRGTASKSSAGRSGATRSTSASGTSRTRTTGTSTSSSRTKSTGASKSGTTRTTSQTPRKSNTLRPRTTYNEADVQENRGRYRGENYGRVNETMTDEIVLIVVLLLCILMVLSYFGICGIVGTGVNAVVFGLFGKLGYALPFIILLFTLMFAANDGRFVSKRRVICSVIFLIIVAALVQMFGFGYDPEISLGSYFTNSLITYEGDFPTGGGFLGGIVVKTLCPLFGKVGAVIIMIAVTLIMMVLITGKAFVTYFSKVVKEKGRIKLEERRIAREERRIYDDIEGNDYDDYDDDDDSVPRVRRRMGSIAVSSGKQPESIIPADISEDVPIEEIEEFAEEESSKVTENLYSRSLPPRETARPAREERPVKKIKRDPSKPFNGRLSDFVGEDYLPKQPETTEQSPVVDSVASNVASNVASSVVASVASPNLNVPASVSNSSFESGINRASTSRNINDDSINRTKANFDNAKSLRAGSNDNGVEATKVNIGYSSDIENGEFEYGPRDFEEAENVVPSNITIIRNLEQTLDSDFKVNISDLEDDFIPTNKYDSLNNETNVPKEDDSTGSLENVSDYSKNSGIRILDKNDEARNIITIEPIEAVKDSATSYSEITKENVDTYVSDRNVSDSNIYNAHEDYSVTEINNATEVVPNTQIVQETHVGQEIQVTHETQVLQDTPKTQASQTVQEPQAYRDSSGAVRFTDMSAAAIEKAEPPQPEYIFPPVSFLRKGTVSNGNEEQKQRDLYETIEKLQRTFESFGVGVKVTDASVGPTVTRYELLPDQGVKVKTITSLSDDIKLALAAAEIRIEAPIPGKAAVGIEVPNKENVPVFFGDLIDSDEFRKSKSKLSIAIGKDISGASIVSDIAGMPHALIAGATGSGKSVCINALIMSILYKAKPSEVKMIMIDPKRVELVGYNGIPHLLVPVVTDVKKATGALNWAIAEMDDRYKRFADCGVTNLASYNNLMEEQFVEEGGEGECPDKLPQIVIIVDELNDLMMTANSKEVEGAICRLTQLARACGIHVVLATQRPSVNVITGTIKANIPTRMAFAVSSLVDSRTIIDQAGAEKLLGKGDMLFYPQGYPKPVRLQGAFVSDGEVKKVVDYIKETNRAVKYNEAVSKHIDSNSEPKAAAAVEEKTAERSSGRDELFEEAGKLIIEKQKASIGMLQRVYRVGFNRAARIMDQLCDAGIVGPEEGTKPRKILMSIEEFEDFINLPEE